VGTESHTSRPAADAGGGDVHAGPAVTRPRLGVLDAVGDTPLIRLERLSAAHPIEVYAKLEASNPGGSIKDRPAAGMIVQAVLRGDVRPGDTVVESTSGNMGVGLAQACTYLGLRLVAVVDARASDHNVRRIRALGGEVVMVSDPDPGTGEFLAARLATVRRIVAETGAYWPSQYENPANPAAHAGGTMREIDQALDGRLDYLFVATSTTGTLRGCGDYLSSMGRSTTIVAVDAIGSALFGGTRASRHLPGLGAGVEPPLAEGVRLDVLVRVADLDCVVGCRRLARTEGLLAGASSGGLVAALSAVAPRMAPGSRAALVMPDGGAGYMRTVFDDEWVSRTLGCDPERLARLVDDRSADLAAAVP